jgi:hypothetical protein
MPAACRIRFASDKGDYGVVECWRNTHPPWACCTFGSVSISALAVPMHVPPAITHTLTLPNTKFEWHLW